MKINFKAIPEAIKVLGKLGEKHLPTILTGVGVAGFIGTAIMAAKAAPKAESAVKKAEREKFGTEAYDEPYEKAPKLTVWEKTKVTAGYYWPSVALGAASTACILSAHKIDLTRLASVTAAYQLSKKDFKELKDKIVEKDGKEKLEEYKSDVRQDRLMSADISRVKESGLGEMKFYEPMTRQFVKNDMWNVLNVLCEMIDDCHNSEGYVPLDDVLGKLGFDETPLSHDMIFMSEFMKELRPKPDDARQLIEIKAIDPDHGNFEPCAYLCFEDRIGSAAEYGVVSRHSFRYS